MNDPVVPKKKNRNMRRSEVGRNETLQIGVIKNWYLQQLPNFIPRRRERGRVERLADLRRAFADGQENVGKGKLSWWREPAKCAC